MLKSDYNVAEASEETREAMRDRCHEQGHDFENCCSVVFQVYQRCKWCGESREAAAKVDAAGEALMIELVNAAEEVLVRFEKERDKRGDDHDFVDYCYHCWSRKMSVRLSAAVGEGRRWLRSLASSREGEGNGHTE